MGDERKIVPGSIHSGNLDAGFWSLGGGNFLLADERIAGAISVT